MRKIEADFQRSADTHLFKLELPSLDGIDIYLKDESPRIQQALSNTDWRVRCFFMRFVMGGLVLKPQ